MSDAIVRLVAGHPHVTLGKQSYVSDWALLVNPPGQTQTHEISVLTRGRGDTGSGFTAHDYWKENDPNTLLRMRTSGSVDGKWRECPLSVEDASDVRGLLV